MLNSMLDSCGLAQHTTTYAAWRYGVENTVQVLSEHGLPDHLGRLVACRSEFVTTDAAGGVGVFPLDRSSVGGVGVDVAAEFVRQVGH